MDEKSGAKSIGVGISGGRATAGGDIVGRDKNVFYEAPVPIIAALHQLPPPPADFTGREAELRDLRAAIEKGGIHISGLQGQGGVGKTALALKLAAELAPNYPDAQIYLDLKGVSEKPLTAAEALSHVLRTFHPEAKLPEREDDLRAHFCSVLHNKRVLLLMDNVKDAAQVKSLIPPEGCTLLVTSRYRFTLPGLHQKNLDTFPPEDAKKFLLEIAPSIKGEAEAIAKLCGYLALALRLAATTIKEHIDLDPAEYRQKLADEKQRLRLLSGDKEEGVDASIALSYNLLDTETQKRWRMLSVFPDTFDAPAAAAVWEMETDSGKEALSRLLQYSILEWNDATKRYRLHDLMRDFARERLTLAESDAAALQLARHYGAVLVAADDLYIKGGDSVMSGLNLFDIETGNIRAGQAWASAHAAENIEAAKLCSDYPNRGAYVLNLRQHPRERIRWCDAALTAARQLRDRAAEAVHLGNLGIAHTDLGEYRRAIEYHEQCLAIAMDSGNRRGEGTALNNVGNNYYMLGDYRCAVEHQEKALQIMRDISDLRIEAQVLGNLGSSYHELGDHRKALQYNEEALRIDRKIGDHMAEGEDLGNLGSIYHSLGEHGRAIECCKQYLTIAHEIGDEQGKGHAHWFMSLPMDKLGDRNNAIEHAEAALKIFEEIEHPNAAEVRKLLEMWRST